MLTIQLELHSRRLGGSAMLVPHVRSWLASSSCRQLLQDILANHMHRPGVLAIADQVKLFVKERVSKDLANATACLDMNVLSVIDSFSTQHFTFKIASVPIASPLRTVTNPFDLMTTPPVSYACATRYVCSHSSLHVDLGWQ
jgi:hypothetical protein